MKLEKYFEVDTNKYVPNSNLKVYRPASLDFPKNEAVMFVTEGFMKYADALEKCKDCLVFWPLNIELPLKIKNLHMIYPVNDPHREYCRFFFDNNIINLPEQEKYEFVNGAFIARTASIGDDCIIFPGAYIGGKVEIGNRVFIGSGVKLVGEIQIGNNVVIRENTVVGADGLSTDRNENGKALTMPQFGGVVIEDDVQIGALTVIARGAIDNTMIRRGTKIDNCSFISHNVQIGSDSFVVGETIMFGSSSTGERAYISGNATIRDGIHIGTEARVGMGAVVTKNVEDRAVVKGNPAR